jgi:serine/threonine protein kinase/Tol biopolymer transport system component
MDPERWQKVESIFQKLVDADSGHRASMLEDACAHDESLRREVESLLTQHEKANEFIERPTFAASSDAPLPRPSSGVPNTVGIPAGTVLGHHRIVGKIGSGGMGLVYEAEELKLRRHVALKFLPEEVARHPQALQRFRLEARAASALNHPNICTIYEVDEVDGRVFIAMELLEGCTLKQTIHQAKGGKPLSVEAVVAMGIQIASAIDAAHSKGIVHRDIKPANIFVMKQRRIKVLDFGLAKLTRRHPGSDETVMTDGTEPGMVMGTVGYMSPEQVRGQTVDGRTDIFAFGAVLYEMLAGRRAFERPTSAETLTAILNEEPRAISELAPDTPLGLVRVVKRCVEKDPEQRFQSASDLAFALEALSESSGATVPAVGQGRPSRRIWAWSAAATGAVFALAGLGVIWWRTPPAVPVVESVNQLTDDGEPKTKVAKTFTDGSRIYFNEGSAPSWKIAQVSISGGPTASIGTALPSAAMVGLSPDGSSALSVTGEIGEAFAPNGPLWSIPLPAGEPRRLGNIEARNAGYLPDGRLIYTEGNDLLIAEKDGMNPRTLVSAAKHITDLGVSPDGRRIAFYAPSDNGFALFEVTSDGNRKRTLYNGPPAGGAVWAPDNKYLLYHTFSNIRQDIWALPMGSTLFHRSNQPIQLTAGPLSYSGLSISRDGKQLFAVGTMERGELVRYDMKSHEFVPFLSGISATFPTFSRDGQWVAYESYPDRSLWRSRSDGSERARLTYPPLVVSNPAISPDGTKVAFTSSVTDDLMVVDMNGTLPPQTVAKNEGEFWSQARNWSPDGKLLLIYIRGELAIYDPRTGKKSVVPSSKDMFGYWIDENTILCVSPPDGTKFLTFDLRTQKWTDLATVGAIVAWEISPDGEYVYYETGGNEPKAWRLRFADRRIQLITSMKEPSRARDLGWVGDIDIAPDGSPIFTRNIGTQEIYALNLRWPK